MSRILVFLWLVMELWWLFLTPTASQDPVVGFLGQSVTLPCQYPSWSQNHNSMCWGKGTCPKSKCNQELVHTDGSKMISRKSAKYSLRGTITKGDISLTISNTNEDDRGVYCCRIEVPGWFNDVKKNIHLKLRRAPTTTRQTTTSRPTTTLYVTTSEMLPTTVMPTTGTLPQTQATSVLTTAATTCSLTTPSSSSEEATGQLTTQTFTEGSVSTEESETFLPSRDSQRSTKAMSTESQRSTKAMSTESQRSTTATSTDPASLTSTGSKVWLHPSTSQVMGWRTSDTRISQLGVSEMTESVNSENQQNQDKRMDKQKYILIIACCIGFMVMLVLLLALVLRGNVTDTNCLQRHKRLDSAGEGKHVLSDMPNGREDEDGLFTL